MNTINDLKIAKAQLYEAIKNIQNFATTNYSESMIKNVREHDKFEMYVELCEDYFHVSQELEDLEYIERAKSEAQGWSKCT